MSFKTAGVLDEQNSETQKLRGLPRDWNNLSANCCPICHESLVLFEHLSLWKCLCGFKITCYRKQEIEGDIELKQNSGFGLGSYDDTPPF